MPRPPGLPKTIYMTLVEKELETNVKKGLYIAAHYLKTACG
jgi:hypothetical protein